MIAKQRQIITFEDVMCDEQTNYSRSPSGAYYRGDAFEQVADLKEVARTYFENGWRIPPEFPEVRNMVAVLLS